ncbi:hypothetical protein GXP70_20825 [Paenibacillus lycopersici]|uniref:Uncharacterized protein n=1 Tax=Paenibacillus lycopersici TaxID=2704462 RepID=A0A6C0G1D2_9BACL|nr:hypothetical protein [Paenibacillus lycopersici]QHT62182.1 hypothetical protein GXP70_20825 [Paenibacillus lycopersici]
MPNLNRLWADCVRDAELHGTAIAITNTTKLRSLREPSYMAEFERDGERYHLYRFAGDPERELRELNAAYALVAPMRAFGVPDAGSAAFVLSTLVDFMDRHFEAIRTSVDCLHGVDRAMRYIRDVRLAQWTPTS